VHHQAGITFFRDDFPLGFFLVLIVRPGQSFEMFLYFQCKLVSHSGHFVA
jgi:hypothetical protein